MSWAETNMELLRNISGSASRRADRAAQAKEGSKDRLFGALSGLSSQLYNKREAEKGREHEFDISTQKSEQDRALERLRQSGDINLQDQRQDWTTDERIAAEKAIEGMPEWNPDLYVGSWTDHNGKLWEWENKQEYDLIRQDIMNEAAERAAAARNERESSDWWPMYEQVASDMMRMSTEIWDPTTGEFVGWNNAGGKEELVNRFTLGMSNRKDLSEEQKQAAIDYFASYLESIENGDVSATIEEGPDGGITIIPPDTYTTQTFEQGTSGQFNPGLKNTWRSEEAVGGGGTQAGAQEKVSPIVEQFWGELEKFTAIEPEVKEVVTSQFTSDIPVQRDDERQMWNQIQSLLSTFTKGDVSTLNDSEERELNLLIRHGTQDNSLSKRQLDQLYDLVRKISENKEEFEGQMNTGILAPQQTTVPQPSEKNYSRMPR